MDTATTQLEAELRLTQAALRGLLMSSAQPRIAAGLVLDQIEALCATHAHTPSEDVYLAASVATRNRVLPSYAQWKQLDAT